MKLDINELTNWLDYSYYDTINTWNLFEEYLPKPNNKVNTNKVKLIALQFSSKVEDIL